MSNIDPRTPILIGAGQVTRHWDGTAPADAPSPMALMVDAAKAALDDTGAAAEIVNAADRVVAVRSMLDSVRGAAQPFGRCKNPPGTLAAAVGMMPERSIYSEVGGDQPQTLVNQTAEAIYGGKADVVLLAGSEATATLKQALRAGQMLDWSGSASGDFEDLGYGDRLLSEYELANGLGAPTQTYPAFEQALRARMGLSREAYADLMAELWAGFSKVAAANPYAQFPAERSAEFLRTPSAENYRVADPYLKWHVAQDAVNQGAAVIMSSVGAAQKAGVDPSKWIFLHGYAGAKDKPVMERPDLSRSLAMEASLRGALEMAGKTASEMNALDLYSCFPCAVLLAAETLDIDWRSTACTITGGLPFFGGAGNNYSMHAIASMIEELRGKPGKFGLVLANGGFLSKEAVGVYSAEPVPSWTPRAANTAQKQVDASSAPLTLSESTAATVETYTVTWKKDSPSRGYVIAANDKGRILARIRTGDAATLMALHNHDPIGLTVQIIHEDGVNYIDSLAVA